MTNVFVQALAWLCPSARLLVLLCSAAMSAPSSCLSWGRRNIGRILENAEQTHSSTILQCTCIQNVTVRILGAIMLFVPAGQLLQQQAEIACKWESNLSLKSGTYATFMAQSSTSTYNLNARSSIFETS